VSGIQFRHLAAGFSGTPICRLKHRNVSENQIKLDPTATPKHIDFTPTEGSSGGKPYVGVYELLRGKRLKSTTVARKTPRPAKIMDRSPNRYEFERQLGGVSGSTCGHRHATASHVTNG
jgi:uncharacterized protein (TIGR03067 family)